MLSKRSLESARELALLLREKNLGLHPDNETPVEDLVERGEVVTHRTDVESDNIEKVTEALEEASIAVSDTMPVSHTAEMDIVTSKIADLVNRRLNLAKNIINPIINDIGEKLIDELGNAAPRAPTVEPLSFSDFYNNPLTPEIFKGYGFDEVQPIRGMIGIQFDETNDPRKALKTGSAFVDNELQHVVESRGDEWFNNVLRKYFIDGNEIAIYRPSIDAAYKENVDESFVAHMVARHLYNQADPKGNYKEHDYNMGLLRILGRTAQNVNGLLAAQKDWEKRDAVVGTVGNEGYTITVYEPNYQRYINSGGSNMAIFGHVRTGVSRSGQRILDEKSSLESVHDKAMIDETMRVVEEKNTLIENAIRKYIPIIVSKIPTEVLDGIPELNEYGDDRNSVLMERGYKFVNEYRGPAAEDPYEYVSRVLVQAMLPELGLLNFYEKLEQYLKPVAGVATLTPKQAAYYVVLDEIITFLLSQTSLSQLSK
nr:MAG TPA: hypothetical protein [Caudoviricetes sp.]